MTENLLSTGKAADEEKLKSNKDFYEETNETREGILGEHFHHGYFEPGSTVSMSDNPAAQIRMIDEVLRFASFSDNQENKPENILDVGCGIGGTCRYLAKKYDSQCKGISISPLDIERAQAFATAQGLQGKVSFEVADALALPFPDGIFDLVLCMETAEYVIDKEKLVKEMVRVAAPGATIIITSWCHRDLSPSEQFLKPDEEKLIRKMCDLMHLPLFCSMADYINFFKSHPLEDIKAEDWSQNASPFWPAMIRSTFTFKGLILLFSGGWKAMKLIMALEKMLKAQKLGLLKLAVVSCKKSLQQ